MDEKWVSCQYIYQDGRTERFREGYEVSNLGRIRSWRKRGFNTGLANAPMAKVPTLEALGYYRVGLTKQNGVYSQFFVHRLVLSSFDPSGWFKGASTCHGQRTGTNDKLANDLENLCWGTPSRNTIEKYYRDGESMGLANGRASCTVDQIQNLLQRIEDGQFPLQTTKRKLPFSVVSAANWFNQYYGKQVSWSTVGRWYKGEQRFDIRRQHDQ